MCRHSELRNYFKCVCTPGGHRRPKNSQNNVYPMSTISHKVQVGMTASFALALL